MCELRSGGRRESSPESDMFPSYIPTGMGSATACLRGLNVDMVEARVGRWSESWCCGTVGVFASLPVGVWSAFSSTTSRTSPSTRLTMLPTTTSRGCAEVKRLPTWRMRSTSFAASRPLNSPTTRRSSAVVAMAQGREFRIWRRLSSLDTSVQRAWRSFPWYPYEIRCSTEGSTGVVFSDLRNVDKPGAWITVDCVMI